MNYTYLCAYHTILCVPQLLPALFNYRLYCHLDIEKGLAIAWSNPFLRARWIPLRRHLLHDPAVDRLALGYELVFVIRPRPQPLDIRLH